MSDADRNPIGKFSPSSPAPGAGEALHLPRNIHYECVMCGRCCRDFWEIPADPPAVERIEALDWRDCSGLPGDAVSPFTPSQTNPENLTLSRLEDGCHFLGDDNLCRLHRKHGLASKPRECQRFPFRFALAPDGLHIGVSFACPVVIDGGGPAVEDQIADIRDLFAREPIVDRDLTAGARLDADTPLAWEDVVAIDASLDEILAREDHPTARCLVAGHVWLGMLGRFVKAAREDQPGAATGDLLHAYADKTRADGYRRVFEIAGRPAANPALKRMLVGSFIAFRGALKPGGGRLATVARLGVLNARHAMRSGSLRLPPFEQKFRWRDFRAVETHLDDPAFQAVLRRYFRHAVERKDLLLYPDIFLGYGFLTLTMALIQWYARAYASLGEDDPRVALGLVEKYFVHHSEFNRVVLRAPVVSRVFDRLLTLPNIGHSLARAEV